MGFALGFAFDVARRRLTVPPSRPPGIPESPLDEREPEPEPELDDDEVDAAAVAADVAAAAAAWTATPAATTDATTTYCDSSRSSGDMSAPRFESAVRTCPGSEKIAAASSPGSAKTSNAA